MYVHNDHEILYRIVVDYEEIQYYMKYFNNELMLV